MGCMGGMSTIRSNILASVFTRAFRTKEKDYYGKKDRRAVCGCNNDRLFAEKYTLKFSFCPQSARKY